MWAAITKEKKEEHTWIVIKAPPERIYRDDFVIKACIMEVGVILN